MNFLVEAAIIAAACPCVSCVGLLAKRLAGEVHRQHTVDDYFRYEEMHTRRRATVMFGEPDRLDEYAVLVRPDLLLDDALGRDIERRMLFRERPCRRRVTI